MRPESTNKPLEEIEQITGTSILKKTAPLLSFFFISTTMSDVRVINEYANVSTILFALFLVLHIKTIINTRNRLFDFTYILLVLVATASAAVNQSGDKTLRHLVAYSSSVCLFGIFIGRIFSAYTIEQLKKSAVYALQAIALGVVLEVAINYFFNSPTVLPRVQDIIYDPPLNFFGVDFVRARGGMVESGHLAIACVGIFAITKALPGVPYNSVAGTVSIFLILILSNSVAGMLSLIVIIFFDIKLRVRYLLMAIFALALALYLFAPSIIGKFSDPSYFDRVNRLVVAYDILEKNPELLFLGVGPGNAPLWGIDGSIVSFLMLLVFEYGSLSLFIFSASLLVLMVKIKKKFEIKKFIMIVLLFFFQSMSISNFWYASFWILPGLLYFISVRRTNKRMDLLSSIV